MNYYNDNDPRCAAWLRELIKDGLIPPGDVDERSIADVAPDDVQGYTQCHFFAGIGGWAYALRLAGWPDDRPVWTGSCPCQPFSCAGARKGTADKRHLWPEFYRLIRECKPGILFGEQVGGTLGEVWLAGVYADLEAAGYRIPRDKDGNPEAYSIPACSVGAPHIRQRLYWAAESTGSRCDDPGEHGGGPSLLPARPEQCGDAGGMADTSQGRWRKRTDETQLERETCGRGQQAQGYGADGRLEHSSSDGWQQGWSESSGWGVASGCGDGGMGNAGAERLPAPECPDLSGTGRTDEGRTIGEPGLSFWSSSIWLPCTDGKARRCPESVLLGMDDGLPSDLDLGGAEGGFPLCEKILGRVMLLRGFGNAIVPQVAAEFVMSYLEVRHA